MKKLNQIEAERNPFLLEVFANLPRVLSMIDMEVENETFGSCDRRYWAWCYTDFQNGTYQGLCHGIARLAANDLWPNGDKTDAIEIVRACFHGASKIIKANGSFEEAFPNEGSFCVTALVAYDLLSAADLMKDFVSNSEISEWLQIISPMIEYLVKHDENHAIISNHLATAVAALLRWHKITSNPYVEQRALDLLSRIFHNFSEEGWFLEYDGADPGYQTLCMYYLQDANNTRPDLGIAEKLKKAKEFITFFLHPDGSFGGNYGARGTTFFYPAGFIGASLENNQEFLFLERIKEAIRSNSLVTLSAIDEPNLIPMFNSYCWAAAVCEMLPSVEKSDNAIITNIYRREFNQAGLLIDAGVNHYTIINFKKGGVVYHFKNDKLNLLNCGVLVRNKKGQKYSTQNYHEKNTYNIDNKSITIESVFLKYSKAYPKPLDTIVIRFLSLTFFRSYNMREIFKKYIVALLMKPSKPIKMKNYRKVILGEEVEIQDLNLPNNLMFSELKTKDFFPIHMASHGYWKNSQSK